jgi:flagellar hook-length control protein FliK
MNGNLGLSNLSVTAPRQQSANNNAGAGIQHNDSSFHFQKTLDDVQATKAKKAKVATTTAYTKQKAAKNNVAIATSNHTQVKNNAVRQKTSQAINKEQETTNELQHSAGDSKQMSNESKARIKDKDKVNSASNVENKQKNAEHLMSDITTPISGDTALGLDVVKEPTLAKSETDGTENLIGNFVFSSPLTNQVVSDQTEAVLLNSSIDGTTAVAQLSINTALDDVDNVLGSANGPLSLYQANADADALIEEALAGSVLSTTSIANSAVDSTAAASLKNSLSPSSILNAESLLASDQQATNTSQDSKSLFEKMVQTISAKTMSAANGDLEQAGTETSNHASGSTANLLVSALDSLSRGPDSLVAAGRSFVAQTAIPVSLGQPQWSQAVGEKVLWLAAQNITAAEIRLDPPELGPLQVKVSLHQDQANVSFTSHHAGVREVLDQNLNRLRDMFNEQGLQLVNVDVSDKSFHRQQGEGKGSQSHGDAAELGDDESLASVSAIVQQRLVDHYA